MFIGPFIPDPYPVFFEVLNIGITLQEPEQLMDDAFGVHFFRGNQGESIFQVKPHLVPKHTQGASSSAVAFLSALIQNMSK
jgi:hypothetical protein